MAVSVLFSVGSRVVFTLLLLAVPFAAAAGQDPAVVRVVRAAAILQGPQPDADAVGTVSPGELLEVLDAHESWFLVRHPVDEASGGWRTGWVSAALVTPVGGFPGPPPQESSSDRGGFIIGFGGGVGFVDSGSSGSGRFATPDQGWRWGVTTDFRIGGVVGSTQIFYLNKVVFLRGSGLGGDAAITGLTGAGVTFMVGPRIHITGGAGAGIYAEDSFALGVGADSDVGFGFVAGLGYEFAARWIVDGSFTYVSADRAGGDILGFMVTVRFLSR